MLIVSLYSLMWRFSIVQLHIYLSAHHKISHIYSIVILMRFSSLWITSHTIFLVFIHFLFCLFSSMFRFLPFLSRIILLIFSLFSSVALVRLLFLRFIIFWCLVFVKGLILLLLSYYFMSHILTTFRINTPLFAHHYPTYISNSNVLITCTYLLIKYWVILHFSSSLNYFYKITKQRKEVTLFHIHCLFFTFTYIKMSH